MTHNLAEGCIRLFGLFLMVSAGIDVARGIVGYLQGTVLLGSGWISVEAVSKGVAWGLVQLAVTFFAGLLILKKSGVLAKVVSQGK